MKKVSISIVVILIIGIILFIAIKGKETDDIQIRTDIEPIYNHFPDLPATETIQWCSKTSSGIGLTTVWVYAFAFYDHDISSEFNDSEISDENPGFYFLPETLAENHSKWRKLENMDVAFQSSIKNGKKMRTSVYLNDTGNILYMEAIGE